MDSALLTFAGISLLLAVTPGPDMAVVTRQALANGRRGVVLCIAGITLALMIHVTASAVGLSALLRASATLFEVLKVVGGVYLAYLGVRSWLASRHTRAEPEAGSTRPLAGSAGILRQGFFSALLNPKLAVFFMTFLPQFVRPRDAVLPRLLLLGLVFAVIGLVWLNVYGLLVTRLRDVITAPRVRQWLERVTGTVLIGFGARLVVERG